MQITKRLYEMKVEELKDIELKIEEQTDEINKLLALGDVSENSEYDFAVNERTMLANQQKELSKVLEESEIVEIEDTPRIVIGSILRLTNTVDNFEKIVLFDGIEDYHKGIIGPSSNLGKKIYGMDASSPITISVETPIGGVTSYIVEKLRNCGENELYTKNNPGLQAKLRELLKDIGRTNDNNNEGRINEEVDPDEMGRALQGYSTQE